jgi:chromosome segregation ATPase
MSDNHHHLRVLEEKRRNLQKAMYTKRRILQHVDMRLRNGYYVNDEERNKLAQGALHLEADIASLHTELETLQATIEAAIPHKEEYRQRSMRRRLWDLDYITTYIQMYETTIKQETEKMERTEDPLIKSELSKEIEYSQYRLENLQNDYDRLQQNIETLNKW